MVFDKETWDELSNYRDYLEHHGVKGMRWGVRKERERTGDGSSRSGDKKEKTKSRMTFYQRRKKARVKKQREAAKKKREAAKKKEAAAAKKEAEKRQKILRSPTKLYKHRYEFSQEDISNALKNFKWEAELQSYSQKQMDQGKKYIDTAFQYANSAINLYNTAARVVNAFDLSDKPWKYIPNTKENKRDDDNKRRSDK